MTVSKNVHYGEILGKCDGGLTLSIVCPHCTASSCRTGLVSITRSTESHARKVTLHLLVIFDDPLLAPRYASCTRTSKFAAGEYRMPRLRYCRPSDQGRCMARLFTSYEHEARSQASSRADLGLASITQSPWTHPPRFEAVFCSRKAIRDTAFNACTPGC